MQTKLGIGLFVYQPIAKWYNRCSSTHQRLRITTLSNIIKCRNSPSRHSPTSGTYTSSICAMYRRTLSIGNTFRLERHPAVFSYFCLRVEKSSFSSTMDLEINAFFKLFNVCDVSACNDCERESKSFIFIDR